MTQRTRPVVVCVPAQEWVERITADGPLDGVEFVVWDLRGEAPRADEIEVVVSPYPTPVDRLGALAQLPNLRVFQVLMAGYDGVLEALPEGVVLCNAAGVHDSATAELAVTLTLAAERRLPEFVAAQERGEWLRLGFTSGLADRRVLILGYGSIGRAIAARLAPFEVTLTAVASRSRAGDDLVAAVHGIDELPELLPQQDIVIVIVPLNETTTHLVDAAFLAAMNEGALLVNVARGKVVDTDALVAACASGHVRAALDVTDPEPLPEGHPLWTTPGVLISPHVGGVTRAFHPRAAALIKRQVAAYAQADGQVSHVIGTASASR